MPNKKEWFGEWFDSPYYHVLYKNRDENEAKEVIDRLFTHFNFNPEDRIMDLACGKGRHAIYMNGKGLNVTGVDLSINSIAHARQYENPTLKFYQHDMREVFKEQMFDYIFNLFTSFGYFDTTEEHAKAIRAMACSLKRGGQLVIDFLNPYLVAHHLVKAEEKNIDGIHFRITKDMDGEGFIIKNISFEDSGVIYNFHEKVRAISKDEFLDYFRSAGLELIGIYGDYDLNDFEEKTSERMIFTTQRK